MGTAEIGVFMAFGTLGDVLPLAFVATALARATSKLSITFVTHASHQVLKTLFASAGVSLCTVSTPPVLPPEQKEQMSVPNALSSEIHMDECLEVIERQEEFGTIKLIAINFFALEGWHIAELLNVRCIVLAPYVMPYSAPSSFERNFKQIHPRLYKSLQQASPDKVGWNEVMHWMWPLFMDRWRSWRIQKLHLSACTLTDPVTELPVHNWPRSIPLLYGFSERVVECPGYWPSSVRVCGFWMPPSSENADDLKPLSPKLSEFLLASSNSKPIFVGLSSISSMGFLHNPAGTLQVLRNVLKRVQRKALLFTAGDESLDAAVANAAESSFGKDGIFLDDNLFCYSGYVPYKILFPKCSLVIHHGGSGTTAACLHAGVPQVICPFILDQFYWAERMSWLGVAPQSLKPHHLVPESNNATNLSESIEAVAAAVTKALSIEIKNNAIDLASSINNEEGGCSSAVQIITEELSIPRV